jgi:hypothetical protein
MRRASDVPVKKPYQPPKLIVYGDLTQLTMKTPRGTTDSAKGKSKT